MKSDILQNRIQLIIKNKIPCYFISPHLDDAAFSAGGLMAYLKGKTKLNVINVFTNSGDGKNTLSAKAYLRQVKIKSPKRLFEIRLREDDEALKNIVNRKYNLDFTDALWRKQEKPGLVKKVLSKIIREFDRVYPTYRFNVISGNIASDEKNLSKEIGLKIKNIIKDERSDYFVFCPLGIGNHVDHLLTRSACEDAFKDNVIYWADYPYCFESNDQNEFVDDNKLSKHYYEITSERKKQICQKYHSQFGVVFKNKKLLFQPEIFYLKIKSKVNNYKVETIFSLNEDIIKKWQTLWNKSPNKHYFNSPDWYIASSSLEDVNTRMLILCYMKSNLVGVLPLVIVKKYGFKAYGFSGRQHLDRAPILLAYEDSDISKILIAKLSEYGNYYLNELEDKTLDKLPDLKSNIGVSISSISSFLPLSLDPQRFIKPYYKNKLIKIIEEVKNDLEIEFLTGSIDNRIKLMKEIELSSSKTDSFMGIFADDYFIRLCRKLYMLNKHNIVTFIVKYKKEPICYRIGFISGKVYHDHNTAYKSVYEGLMPGKISLITLLEELKNKGMESINLSRGLTQIKKEITPYFYKQYSICYSKNKYIYFWWKGLNYLKNNLERHPKLFEIARLTKNRLGLNFGRIFNSVGVTEK